MSAPSFALVNRAAEALEALLHSDPAKAVDNLRSLTRTELEDLETATRALNELVWQVLRQTWPGRYE